MNYDANISDTLIWIAMLNGAAEEIRIQDDNLNNELIIQNYKSHRDIVSFSSKSSSLSIYVNGTEKSTQWTAYQAVVIAYSKELESSSCPFDSQTFDFAANSDLVIPISPTFGTFKTKFFYKACTWQFKIAPSQQLKVVSVKMNTVILFLMNDTTNVYNFTDKNNKNVEYFSGTTFNLTYEFSYANISDPTFFLLVSAVTPAEKNITDNCSTSYDDMSQTTTYSNRNLIEGYPSNQYCSDPIKISDHHEATLTFTETDYEIFADKLFLIQGNQKFDINVPDFNQLSYILTADIVPNPICMDAYIHIEFTNNLRVTVDDYVEFRWNGIKDLNVTSKLMSTINRYYSPPSNMTLHFHSGPSPSFVTTELQQWHFNISSIVTPVFVKIILSQKTPKYVQWLADMGENDALTVCTVNGTLELLFTESNVNCVEVNNVFQIPYTFTDPPEYDVSVKSTNFGSCKMIILSSSGYYSSILPHVWIKNITADSDSMYLFQSGINGKQYMNLNGSEASKWHSFNIYTPALIIVVPPSSSITVHLSYFYPPSEQIINVNKNGTQKGIMVSPSYSGFLKSFDNSSLYSSDGLISQFSLNLDVKNIYGTSFPSIEYGLGQRLSINQSMNISTSGFNLYYNDNGKPKENGFLIEYTIQPM
uniref:CUB-like domain-containing protein n=1 Tax=Panagrolaimus sp. ES5 TaxID=591445 RepID=A0AC34F2W4_9BILA